MKALSYFLKIRGMSKYGVMYDLLNRTRSHVIPKVMGAFSSPFLERCSDVSETFPATQKPCSLQCSRSLNVKVDVENIRNIKAFSNCVRTINKRDKTKKTSEYLIRTLTNVDAAQG